MSGSWGRVQPLDKSDRSGFNFPPMGRRDSARGKACGKTHDPALSALLAISALRSTRQEVGFSAQRLDSNLIPLKKRIAFTLRREVDAKLGVNQITHDQGPQRCRLLQSHDRSFTEALVRHENVQQNVRVDHGNHRPRTSSMNRSTDVYPKLGKTVLAAPLPLSQIEPLRRFLQHDRTMDRAELDFRLRPKTESVPNFFRDRDLTPFADSHTS
jgi:hypothetical protein